MGYLQPLLKVRDVMRILNYSRSTIKLLVRSGKLKPVRLGGVSLRFYTDDVEAFMACQSTAVPPSTALRDR